ncbi:MAG: hypothetical protein II889_13465 [Clostridia bacterium]|nr:hypothetical protein [Clostridia bacterium]
MKRFQRAAALLLSLLLLAPACSRGEEPEESPPTPDAETTAPAEEETEFRPEVLDAEETIAAEVYYPKGGTAKTVIRIPEPASYGEKLTLASLQGLAARLSDEKILFRVGASDLYTPYMEKDWGVTITNRIGGKPANFENLLAGYRELCAGYILAAKDPADPSVSVAVSLAGILDCVIATPDTRAAVEKAGYPLVLDVTGCDEKWLRASEYWDQLNRNFAFEQPASMAPKLVDYAVMAGAYFGFYDGKVAAGHKKMYDFLNDGAIVFGYNNTLGEYDAVKSFSEMNIQMVPSDHAYNLSTLSCFPQYELKQKEREIPETPEAVHTLCIVMSDGDNIQWVLNNFATSSEWFANPHRGQFAIGWGVSPALLDTAAPMLAYLYDKATPRDEFMMQLSGLGYTFPSRWDQSERQKMAHRLAEVMRRADLHYAEILDDGGFTAENLGDFAAEEGIDGLFYIDYSHYSGLGGEILWLDGKPAVSARHMIWADHPTGNLGFIARRINNAPTDPADEGAYTFLIVHAWSGLKDGKLTQHGNTLDAVAALIEDLDEDVQIVTPGAFMERLIANCAPKG